MIQAMLLVGSIESPEITSTKKMLLMAMANYANNEYLLWPSYQTLANYSRMSRRSVIRCANDLEKLGIIKIKKRRINDSLSQSNYYKLEIIPWLQKNGYTITTNKDGFLSASLSSDTVSPPPKSSDIVSPPVVTESHHPSDIVSPNPVNEPVSKPVINPKNKNGSSYVKKERPSATENLTDQSWFGGLVTDKSLLNGNDVIDH